MFIITNDHLPTLIVVKPDGTWPCLGNYPDLDAAHSAANGWNAHPSSGCTYYVSSMSTTDLLNHFSDELPMAA